MIFSRKVPAYKTLMALINGAEIGYIWEENVNDFCIKTDKGWEICSGNRFDPRQYPVLYEVLGTNRFPDIVEARKMAYGDVNISETSSR